MELIERVFEILITAAMVVVLFLAIVGGAFEIFSDFEHEAKQKLRSRSGRNPKLYALGMLALGIAAWVIVPIVFIGGCSGRSPHLY